jgi:hypothetical protein
VISFYRRLFETEKSFRMSKSDLQARPVYHRKRDSIEAHLTIVFAALAVSRLRHECERLKLALAEAMVQLTVLPEAAVPFDPAAADNP